ncbi:AraC family transcriptional regulator [Hungatella sp. SB206]|uniref:AraC family transcriptional regulator n=1 Tax=Hungatella sp. SB206 TaxID=2937758 RepID=UPI003DAA442B
MINPALITGSTFPPIPIRKKPRVLPNAPMIAELCGYTNMNFFYRKFKEMYGMSPKQYRGR